MDEQLQPERPKYTPKDGEPGPKEIEHRREQAQGILNIRKIRLAPNYDQMSLLVSGIATMLKHRGLIGSDQELEYWMQLAEVESLEQVVEASAPKNIIHLPGRPS